MPGPAVRPATLRAFDRLGDAAAVGLVVAWAVVLSLILRHRIYVAQDTLINYAHVWFIGEQLRHAHWIPLHMASLGHGQAFVFPYGLVPWLTAGVLRPFAGDWIVTLWFVVGAVGLVMATFYAFPELRRGWWAAAVLTNPALFVAPLLGQLPFLWGASLLLGAVGLWRRERRSLATLLAALAQVTHPAVVAPIALGVVAGRLRWEGDSAAKARLLRHYVLSVLPALPAAWIVSRSPVFADTSMGVKLGAFVGTLVPRSLVVVVPIGLVLLRRLKARWPGPASVAALAVLGWAVWTPLGMPFAWRGLHRTPDTEVASFTRSPAFQAGATYRVLRIADGKVGMYQLLRAGARLDSEFFPESIIRRNWPTEESYSAFLRGRNVDYVMVWDSFLRRYPINERDRLDELRTTGCRGPLVCVELVQQFPDYRLYRVTRSGLSPPPANT